jgi:PAS domain S-box-containing protein
VNSLLDFSRIEAGRIQAVYKPTDLSAYTIDLASVFRSAVEKAGLHLNVDCPTLPEPIFVDKEMWEKIVLNLLSNAFKFTFEGEITVSLNWCEDHVELKVKDTGTGIAPEEMPHLFERFHRIKGVKSRTYEGTGIGLALVQELVKLHGGSIKAQSTLGVGTTFTVSIPIGHAHLPADRISATRTLTSTSIGAAPYVKEAMMLLTEGISSDLDQGNKNYSAYIPADGNKAHVLLADDNADMRGYINRLLSSYYEVEAVADGRAALEVALKNPPDIILTDIMMPIMDGFKLLKILRADPKTRSIPVIFLSARAGEEAKVEGMEAGADDYLVKPFSARELMARVAAHLQMAQVRREAALKERELRKELERELEERKKVEKALKESEQKYRTIFTVANDGFWWTDSKLIIIEASEGIARLLGYRVEELIGRSGYDFVDRDWLARASKEWEDRKAGKSARYDFKIKHKNGSSIWVRLSGSPVMDEQGRFIGNLTAFTDITKRKHAEEALKKAYDTLEEKVEERTEELERAYNSLKESEERFRVAVKNSSLVLSQFDLDLRYIWVYNPHPDFDVSMLIGKRGDELEYSDEMRQFIALRRQVLGSGKGIREEISFNRSDGVHTYDTIIEPLFNDTGDVIGGTVSALDITERKKAEEALAMIKIVRKQEIHHRIKNNLQVISSLLDLQAEKFNGKKNIEDSQILEAFRESQNRVISMALIHEELYKGDRFDTINFSRYINELADNLLSTYSVGNNGIILSTDIEEDIFFDMDTSVPLGIVINELISNSLKHAFPFRDSGEIQIKLHREENEKCENEDCKSTSYVLSVSDNGVGIPENLEIEDLDSLGIQLVTTLVDQLDGELELRRNNGSEFIVRFSVTERNNQVY